MSSLVIPKKEFFKERRGHHTIQEFADLLDVSYRTAVKFLNGESVRIGSIRSAAKGLDIDEEHLEVLYFRDSSGGGKSDGVLSPVTVIRVHPHFGRQINPFANTSSLGRLLPIYRAIITNAVASEDGQEVSSVSGEVVAIFPDRTSSAQSATRAVRAALRIQREIRNNTVLTPSADDWLVAPRIGIHTHEAYTIGSQTVFTCAAYVAAELQRAAGPNCILVGTNTHQFLRDKKLWTFVQRDRIPLPYQAPDIEPQAIASWEVSAAPPLSVKLVGRDTAMNDLYESLHGLDRDAPQFVIISGREGIGKTHLVREFEEDFASSRTQFAKCECCQALTTGKLMPIVQLLRDVLQLGDTDHREGPTKLKEQLKSLRIAWQERYDILHPLLFKGRIAVTRDHDRLFRLIYDVIRDVSIERQLVLVIDNLQWCDEASHEFLQFLHRELSDEPTQRVMVVLLVRGDQQELAARGWASKAHEIRLESLDVTSMTRLARRLFEEQRNRTGQDPLVDDVRLLDVVERSNGTPLQVVTELNRLLCGVPGPPWPADSGDEGMDHGVKYLQAMIGGNEDAVDVLAIASILGNSGNQFDYEVLHASWRALPGERSEEKLVGSLAELTEKGFLACTTNGRLKYFIKERLSVVARALELIPETEVARLHANVAEALERIHPGTHPETLARHYEAGKQTWKAIAAWRLSGEFTLQTPFLAAHQGAAQDFKHALDLIPVGALSVDQKRLKLETTIGVIQSLMGQSYASQEIEEYLALAESLLVDVKIPELEYKVVRAAWAKWQNVSRLDEALKCVFELKRITAETDLVKRKPHALIEVHHAAAVTYFTQGEFAKAIEQQDAAVKLLEDRPNLREACLEYSDHEPAGCCLIMQACSYIFLGNYDAAETRRTRALQTLGDKPHPGTKMVISCYSALLDVLKSGLRPFDRQRVELLESANAEAVAAELLAAKHKASHWHAMAVLLRGITEAHLAADAEQVKQAIVRIRQGIDRWCERDARGMLSLWQTYLASAYIQLHRLSGGDPADLKRATEQLGQAHELTNGNHQEQFSRGLIESGFAALERARGNEQAAAEWDRAAEATAVKQGIAAMPFEFTPRRRPVSTAHPA